MHTDYYITPEEYLKAKENGISERLFEDRIRRYNWSKRRAMTTPKMLKGESIFTKEQLVTARENGIRPETAYGRVKRLGWSIEDAISKPVLVNGERYLRKKPNEAMQTAVSNGISEQLFRERVARGWSKEEASTMPPLRVGHKRKKVAISE